MSASPAFDSLRAHFAALRDERAGREPVWLTRLRDEAMKSFESLGLPTTRLEDWRFTSLAKLAQIELCEAAVAPRISNDWIESTHKAVGAEHRLVFGHGLFRGDLSVFGELPDGVKLGSLAELIADDPDRLEGRLGSCVDLKTNALAALNSALFCDGAVIELPAGVSVAQPIHLVFVQTGGDVHVAAHPRVLVLAGAGARATIVEHYIGEAPQGGLSNPTTEVCLAREAQVHHVALQESRPESFHLASMYSRQESGSYFGSHSIAMGEGLSRLEISSLLAGEGAHVDLNGIYLARGQQHVDHHTTIDHAVPHTTSKELYKGILDERGRGVFHGRIHVRPDAQKIDASQTNRALLLSDAASIDTKPQLEIYADDVKCSHGASIGQLDEDQLFYLRSRGMSLEDARSALTFAFLAEVVEELPLEPLRDYLKYAILRWLPSGLHA